MRPIIRRAPLTRPSSLGLLCFLANHDGIIGNNYGALLQNRPRHALSLTNLPYRSLPAEWTSFSRRQQNRSLQSRTIFDVKIVYNLNHYIFFSSKSSLELQVFALPKTEASGFRKNLFQHSPLHWTSSKWQSLSTTCTLHVEVYMNCRYPHIHSISKFKLMWQSIWFML